MIKDFCIGGPLMEGPDLTTMDMLKESQIKNQSELLFDASVYWFNVSFLFIFSKTFLVCSFFMKLKTSLVTYIF